MKDLRGRIAVVTGAGSGIGLATARALHAAGCRVHCVDIDPERVARVADELDGVPHVVDVCDGEAVQALADAVLVQEGRVDIVHNNAGVGLAKSFLDTTEDDWRWIVDVNLWGVIHGCRAFAPIMVAQGEGVIVNTASVLGLFTVPGVSAYAATKHAIVGLSETMHMELAHHGVQVIALCPGLIKTNIVVDGRVSTPRDPQGERTRKGFDTFGVEPEVVARAVVRGIRRGGPQVITPNHARFAAWTKRQFPRIHRFAVSRLM